MSTHGNSWPVKPGLVHVTEYRDVADVLRSSSFSPVPDRPQRALIGGSIIGLHGDDHLQRRRIHSQLFRPENLRDYEKSVLEPASRQVIDSAIANATEGYINLVSVTRSILLHIAARIIGLQNWKSTARIAELEDLLYRLIEGIDVDWCKGDRDMVLADAMDAREIFWKDFVCPALSKNLSQLSVATHIEDVALTGDLLGILASESVESPGQWSDETILNECVLYLVASVLTTSSTVTNTLLLMGRYPEQCPVDDAGEMDPDLLEEVIHESMRVMPPASPVVERLCLETTTLSSGREIVEGERVGCHIFAANRDRTAFGDEPDEFIVGRESTVARHGYGLAFGHGPHVCIGKPLAIGHRGAGTLGAAQVILRDLLRAGILIGDNSQVNASSSDRLRYDSFNVRIGSR